MDNHQLISMLETLKFYQDCQITHTFTDETRSIVSVSYMKELDSYQIIDSGSNSKAVVKDTHSAAEALHHTMDLYYHTR